MTERDHVVTQVGSPADMRHSFLTMILLASPWVLSSCGVGASGGPPGLYETSVFCLVELESGLDGPWRFDDALLVGPDEITDTPLFGGDDHGPGEDAVALADRIRREVGSPEDWRAPALLQPGLYELTVRGRVELMGTVQDLVRLWRETYVPSDG